MSINEYIDRIVGSKEVSLCLLEDSDFGTTIQTLESRGFSVFDINNFSNGKYYMLLSAENSQKLYSFASEYPTGQISFVDSEGKRTWYSPDYEMNSFVFLSTKETIEKLKEKNIDFLSVCGMTYQK